MVNHTTLFITPDSLMPENPLPRLDIPLAVVCHDAGAANLVFAWLKAMALAGAELSNWRICLAGPALSIWSQNPMKDAALVLDPAEALVGARTLLTGTGWSSSLEHNARLLAAQRGIRSIAAIDHWVNYRARFERDSQMCMPDEVWVGDECAKAEAKSSLPEVFVRQLPNLYLADCAASIRPLVTQRELLYVLEPIRANWGDSQACEFVALDYFIRHYDLVTSGYSMGIRLRPHPSDPSGKYDEWIDAHSNLGVSLDDSSTLDEAIGRASVVCGAETFAMVIALAAGRRVWSTLPPHAHRCRLPLSGILHLRDFVTLSQTGDS
jgi:hypothetical protein